jgi:hypothetical protein
MLRRRVAAFLALALGLASLYLILDPVLPNRGRPEATAVAAPARPASAPTRIPAWAWELYDWEATEPALRPPRPAIAPQRVPAWYAEWRAWRVTLR